ncbi:hypothetical protein EDD22DRAFT_971045 [Suillus occidentalis]|nr:hypothetical protein EDD22DRAFT_971045 [Suillus occidentalis]
MKLMSRFPYPEDAALDCMDPKEGQQALPKETEDDSTLLHNHFQHSPIIPHNYEELIIPQSAIDIHQSRSSSLTHVFKGHALTSVTHGVVTVYTKSDCLEDEVVNSACNTDSLCRDSGDDSPNGGSLAMDIEDNTNSEELSVQPKPLPTGPIPPIDSLRIILNMIKCITKGCASHTLFISTKPFHKHCVQFHGKLPLSHCLHTITPLPPRSQIHLQLEQSLPKWTNAGDPVARAWISTPLWVMYKLMGAALYCAIHYAMTGRLFKMKNVLQFLTQKFQPVAMGNYKVIQTYWDSSKLDESEFLPQITAHHVQCLSHTGEGSPTKNYNIYVHLSSSELYQPRTDSSTTLSTPSSTFLPSLTYPENATASSSSTLSRTF